MKLDLVAIGAILLAIILTIMAFLAIKGPAVDHAVRMSDIQKIIDQAIANGWEPPQ